MSRKMKDREMSTPTPAGYAIKQLRLRKRMTQTELAEAAGLGTPTVCHIEQGKANPTMSTIEKLGRVLGPLALQTEIAAEMRRRGVDDSAVMAQHASIKAAQVAVVEGEG